MKPLRKLKTSDDVLKMIGAKDWRSVSKNQYIKLVSSLSYMDKDVALECLRQFPNFIDFSKETIQEVSSICKKAIESNENITKEVIRVYEKQIDNLNDRLQKDDISEEESESIRSDMYDLIKDLKEIDQTNKQFFLDLITNIGIIAGAAFTIAAATIGVSAQISGGTSDNTNNSNV